MQGAIKQLKDGSPTQFSIPGGIVKKIICKISGTEPSEWCPDQRLEYFAVDQPPLPSDKDLWSKVVIDTWTGLRASIDCQDFTKEEHVLNVTDPWAIGWLQNDTQGKEWLEEMGFSNPLRFAPGRECTASDPHPVIDISSITDGQTISNSPVDIVAKIDASADFKSYTLDYGLGDEPAEWIRLLESDQPSSQSKKIYSWDLTEIPQGVITLRVKINSIRGGYAERKIHVNILIPSPTPTTTPTPTITPTRTHTPTLTPSPTFPPTTIPSVTPTVSSTPISIPIDTPTVTPTPDDSDE